MDKFKKFIDAATGEMLWVVILVPILTISWLGFYTIARSIGIPPIFAAGMSAAFDGIALFAARIGLKHRRKGFSGYLARITVVAFAALGAFVQSFHAESSAWINAHSWIVWATAPVAAVLAYELHLGWVHRKQLIRKGYVHPSAKSGFGPATWFHFPRETLHEYRDVLRARRAFIATGNLARFQLEDAQQPAEKPVPVSKPKPEPLHSVPPIVPALPARTKPSTRPTPSRPAASKPVQPARQSVQKVVRDTTESQRRRAWAVEHGFKLGHNGRVPIEALDAYRAAHRSTGRAA